MAEQLRDNIKSRMTLKGHLDTYRCCDDVWTLVVKDIQFKMDSGEIINADKVKIVACNSRRTGE